MDERVRIGLVVRETEIRFRLIGKFRVDTDNGDVVDLSGGSFIAKVSTPTSEPQWGQRLQTFTGPEPAKLLHQEYGTFGIDTRIVELGRPAHWGAAGELQTTSWAIVYGEESSPEAALEQVRSMYGTLPAKRGEGAVAGWKRYKNQLLPPDPIRLNPPTGGQIQLLFEDGRTQTIPSPACFKSLDGLSHFELGAVRIGIEFHWDHVETLPFRGSLEIVADGNRLTAVNELELDEYLAAVLGSEMRPDWPVESLAAQAVAARSTVLATRGRHHYGEAFDLCHDDHCQCYQGISRESETARQALLSVKGLLLAKDGRVADARYAKSCGGVADHYHVAWDEEDISYMQPVICGPLEQHKPQTNPLDLSGEDLLHQFLETPPAFAACNPESVHYPPSCSEMEELFRWNRRITRDQLKVLVEKRSSRKLGFIRDLVPLEVGRSGRIRYLRVVGESGDIVVGKELAIRRLLSDSHLPSSAFVVHWEKNGDLRLEGIGWGHGVGMCQLGAAALASEGWSSNQLLKHYYPGATLVSK